MLVGIIAIGSVRYKIPVPLAGCERRRPLRYRPRLKLRTRDEGALLGLVASRTEISSTGSAEAEPKPPTRFPSMGVTRVTSKSGCPGTVVPGPMREVASCSPSLRGASLHIRQKPLWAGDPSAIAPDIGLRRRIVGAEALRTESDRVGRALILVTGVVLISVVAVAVVV